MIPWAIVAIACFGGSILLAISFGKAVSTLERIFSEDREIRDGIDELEDWANDYGDMYG